MITMNMDEKVDGGLFISFEGIEGSGKSTQSRMLSSRLRRDGYNVLETREPGGTRVGDDLRNIVQHVCGKNAVCTEAELLIFCASRAQLVSRVIIPHLESGGIVVCDRFADSTTAYQGYGRGIDLRVISDLHRFTVFDRWPDITILLDLDVRLGLCRSRTQSKAQGIQDRIEDEPLRFHEEVRQGFLKLAEQNAARIKVLSANTPPELIHEKITESIYHVLDGLPRPLSKCRQALVPDPPQ